MAYTTVNKSTDYFNTLLHTGNDASPRSLTGVGFQPDFVWLKRRNDASSHTLYDAVRTAGSTKGIASNSSAAEGLSATEGTTANYGYINSFDSDGFSVTTGASNDNYVNNSSDTYVSWNWKANGAGSANSDGTTASTVSVNTTAGFSIVKYNGTGANATVGHGLGVAPKVIIVKNLESSYEWIIGHADLDTNGTGFSDNWYFNGFGTGARNQNATASWNSTDPTTSVFSLHSGATYMNASGESNIAYCFAEKTGFSKFGKYIGNGNTDGSFVYTGFKPAWVLMKNSTQSGDRWTLYDNKRDTINPTYRRLFPDGSLAESANTDADIDLLSNGFKLRTDAGTTSTNNETYIYMAFAEAPLVGSNNVPATAR